MDNNEFHQVDEVKASWQHKKSATDALKTASKIVIQKTVKATGDLIGDKIASKAIGIASQISCEDVSKSTTPKQIDETSTGVPIGILNKNLYHQKSNNKLIMIIDYFKYKHLQIEWNLKKP